MEKTTTETEKKTSYILRAMESLETSGNTYTDAYALFRSCRDAMHFDTFRRDLEELIGQGQLRCDDSRIYHTRTLESEIACAEHLAEILTSNTMPVPLLPSTLTVNGVQLSDEQRQAIMVALSHRLSLILGGAGTGKSTVIEGLLQTSHCDKEEFLLAAPTGKAASHLRDTLGRNADTIQLYLCMGDNLDWSQIKLIVIDEAGMMSLEVFNSLLARCDEDCRLVLVGDPQQLPCVGAGNVLSDLIALGVPSVTLHTTHRQQDACSALAWNIAHLHQLRRSDELRRDGSFRLIKAPDNEIADIVCPRVAELYQQGSNCQLLTATKKPERLFSTAFFNKALQPLVNPAEGNPLRYGPEYLWLGDRIIVTSNQRDIQCYNGDCGTLVLPGEDDETSAIAALLLNNGQLRPIGCEEQLYDMALAYAITVHKSQGSEYDSVFLSLPEADKSLFYRNLLYTAVTRSKRSVTLVGSAKTLDHALRTPAPKRNSALIERTRLAMSGGFAAA